jgi:ketosteroid isomerase-like protein
VLRKFLMVAISSIALGQASAQAAPEIAVPALVRSFYAAEQAYDPAALAKLISRQYVEISPLGEVDAHDRFLGFYTPDKKADWPPFTLSEEQVRVFGSTAVDVLKLTYSMPAPDGTKHPMEFRVTFVAGLEDGQYKLLSAQFTGIRPAAAPQPAKK